MIFGAPVDTAVIFGRAITSPRLYTVEPLDVIECEERPLLEEPVRKPDDILEQISRLKNLLDAEAISREEYETLKKKLFR